MLLCGNGKNKHKHANRTNTVGLPHAHLGPGGQGAVLDEGVVSGNLVILHPLLHPVLQVVDVDRPLLRQ